MQALRKQGPVQNLEALLPRLCLPRTLTSGKDRHSHVMAKAPSAKDGSPSCRRVTGVTMPTLVRCRPGWLLGVGPGTLEEMACPPTRHDCECPGPL